MPTAGAHDIRSFSADEAFRLVTAASLPLADYDTPPTKDWFPELEECEFQRMLNDGEEVCWPYQFAYDVYCTLGDLLHAFDRVEMRAKQIFSRSNFERVQTAINRLRSAEISLKNPAVKLLSGDDELLAERISVKVAKLSFWADILDRETKLRKGEGDDQSLEEFIRGPLSHGYTELFGRPAGGNERGPFARFGECFFAMVGHPVARGTITRAVKSRRTP